MMKKNVFLLLGLLFSTIAYTQVRVENASFEGEPQDATMPVRWHLCTEETTPDILPGFFGVHKEASDGETYMGLITRGIGTWESVGQRLIEPLNQNECYSFSVDLAHSSTYAGYNMPVKFVIYGSTRKCSKDQKIGEVAYVDHEDWRRYDFRFTTKVPVNYIIMEANFMDGLTFPYKGNVLIDNCSPIRPCRRAMLD